MIGYWGYLQFEVNDDWWQYPANIVRTAKGRWAIKYPANTTDRPKMQFLGADVGEMTFTMFFDQRFFKGGNIRDLLSEFVIWVNTGVTGELVIGTKVYGYNKWCCTQATLKFKEVIHKGIILRAAVEVTLKEC